MATTHNSNSNSSNSNSNVKNTSQSHQSNNPRKILIVDDEPDITSSFDMILQMNGFEVDTYNDPILSLSNFKPGMYGLALLDIMMSKMNGFELQVFAPFVFFVFYTFSI
ncbi:MAG TPA: response regulator [Nitrososphaeraceae archaeon]|nr:response regulator [Nitrososphaeraceae archaeon]